MVDRAETFILTLTASTRRDVGHMEDTIVSKAAQGKSARVLILLWRRLWQYETYAGGVSKGDCATSQHYAGGSASLHCTECQLRNIK